MSLQLSKLKKKIPLHKERMKAALGYSVPVVSAGAIKGGVGKTTTNIAIAECASLQLGLRVAYLDMDYQANGIESFFGTDAIERDPRTQEVLAPENPDYLKYAEKYNGDCEERSSIYDLWLSKYPLPLKTPLSKEGVYEGCVDLFPCDSMKCLKARAHMERNPGHVNWLQQFIELHLAPHYDMVVIDIGPTRSKEQDAVMNALTHMTFVVKPENCSDSYIPSLRARLEQENVSRGKGRAPIQFLGFTVNMFDGHSAHIDSLAMLTVMEGEENILPSIKDRQYIKKIKATDDEAKRFRLFKSNVPKSDIPVQNEWFSYMEALFARIYTVSNVENI